jgi:hypothetical protein
MYRLGSATLPCKFLVACFALALAVAAAPGIGNAASSSAYAKSGPSSQAKRIEVGVAGRKYFVRSIMLPDDRRDAGRQARAPQ